MPRSQMRTTRRAVWTAATVSAVLATTLGAAGTAAAQPAPNPGGPVVRTDDTGQVRQLTPGADRAGFAPGRGTAGVLDGVLGAFGNPAGSLDVAQTFPIGNGSTVRLQQSIDGVEVAGGVLSLSLDGGGSLLSATGATAPTSQGSFPTDGAAAAAEAAAAAPGLVAADTGVDASGLAVVGVPEPTWFDAHLLSTPGRNVAVPAYKVQVTGGLDEKWDAYVDAGDATLLDSVPLIADVNRVVCDANRQRVNTSYATLQQLRCGTTFGVTRSEGGAASSVADVNAVYGYFGDTQNLYAAGTGVKDLSAFIGADYRDGRGTALRGTVRICDTSQCPYENAFWDGEQMVFGEGVSTDDITGHELTHGVTQKTSGLVYQNESGAINEAMSDIFGELTDLSNGSADDTAANRWLIGEGSSLGAIRSMKDPGQFGDPDSTTSPNYYRGTNQSALVHINSGVANKAAYLVSDGGSLNGRTVTGIGTGKTAQLFWTVQTMLTPSATYADLGSTMVSACNANAANRVAGTTTADCTQVRSAAQATGMI